MGSPASAEDCNSTSRTISEIISDKGRHAEARPTLGLSINATGKTATDGNGIGTSHATLDATRRSRLAAGTSVTGFAGRWEIAGMLQSRLTVVEQSGQTPALFTPDRSLQIEDPAFQHGLRGVRRRRNGIRNRRYRDATLTEPDRRTHRTDGVRRRSFFRYAGRTQTTQQNLPGRKRGHATQTPLYATQRSDRRNRIWN